MSNNLLYNKTKAFALRVIGLVQALPKSQVAHVIGQQLLRSATSVGANYRSVCRARSRADFIAKLRIVEEESDESLYWMELLMDTGEIKQGLLGGLMKEAGEITALCVASAKTARSRR